MGKIIKKASQQHHLFILLLIPTYLILVRPLQHGLREFLKQLFPFPFCYLLFSLFGWGFLLLFSGFFNITIGQWYCINKYVLSLYSTMMWLCFGNVVSFTPPLWFYYRDSITTHLLFPRCQKSKLVTARINTWRSNKRIRLFIWLCIVNTYKDSSILFY